MRADSGESCSRGIRIYNKNAALDQRPRAWITESSNPAWAAAVAAPIRKLWPANWLAGKAIVVRALRTSRINTDFVSGFPWESLKNGPGASPREERYARTAVTGQTGLPVFPTKTSTPEPNWSHLDCFRKKRMTEGLARSSTATWNRKSEIYHKTSHQPIHLTSWDMYTCQTKLIKCLKEVDASYDRVGSSKTGYRVVTTTLDVLSFP